MSELIEKSISGLYYSYGHVKDENIREILQTVKIVKKAEIGQSGEFAYYELVPDYLDKIIESPRQVSVNFDGKTIKEPMKGLEEYKTFTFLVKSSSRFFLKADIGEVIDQIPFHDRICPGFHAICINDEYQLLEDTEGEHFIMTATLLIDKERERREAIRELHKLQ